MIRRFGCVKFLKTGLRASPWTGGSNALQPTRKEMRNRLAAVEAATAAIVAALNDNATMEFLGTEATSTPVKRTQLAQVLVDLGRSARQARGSPALSTEKGRTRSGRGRALLPEAFSSQVLCAAIIAEAWAIIRGQPPAPSNLDAAAAAATFWRLSGGSTKSWGDNPLKAWRPFFVQANRPQAGTIREEIRRHLKNGRHFGTSE
jgi:hypothetical protein